MPLHHSVAVAWLIVFVGGVIVYIRGTEKTFRDNLEKSKERYYRIIEDIAPITLDNDKELDKNKITAVCKSAIDQIVDELEYLSNPTRTMLIMCAVVTLALLTTQIFFILFDIRCFHKMGSVSHWYPSSLIIFYFVCMYLYICAFRVNCMWREKVVDIETDFGETAVDVRIVIYQHLQELQAKKKEKFL